MTRWTHSQVAALAPDLAALSAARRLARPAPWSETGSTDLLVWGKCQGSGRTPYQVSIDLNGPAFRCTCPSRKFPCKHGLALLLLWVDGSGSVGEVEEAVGYARVWAAERAARAESQTSGQPARPARTPDPAAAARRLEDRLALMTGGMDDFARWLTDLARGGTAAVRQQPYGWWDATAARLVDAQLPGVAEDVRAVGGEVVSGSDWAERVLQAMGRWWVATRAWAARDSLDEGRFADLRSYLGWATSTDSVRRGDAIADRWLVLGAHRSDDGRLQQQRTWLRSSASGAVVQVLDFAAGPQVLPVARTVGSRLDATLARYPGAGVRRALFVTEPAVTEPAGNETAGNETAGPAGPSGSAAHGDGAPSWAGVSTLMEARASAADIAGANPWTRRVPVGLAGVQIGLVERSSAQVVDVAGNSMALTEEVDTFALLALTGGQPVAMFAELEDARLRPLSVLVDDELVGL